MSNNKCYYVPGREESPDSRLWRTLVRVVSVVKTQEGAISSFVGVIPGYSAREKLTFGPDTLERMPEGLVTQLTSGYRFFAKGNIGTKEPNTLYLTDFEI